MTGPKRKIPGSGMIEPVSKQISRRTQCSRETARFPRDFAKCGPRLEFWGCVEATPLVGDVEIWHHGARAGDVLSAYPLNESRHRPRTRRARMAGRGAAIAVYRERARYSRPIWRSRSRAMPHAGSGGWHNI